LWKSARRQRLAKYSEGGRQAHHRSSETGIYAAATSTQAVGRFIGHRVEPILVRTKGHRRLSPP
jgi:hypothetical protein